jgi:hypothetical protein
MTTAGINLATFLIYFSTPNVKWTAYSPFILEWMALEHGALKASCYIDADEIPHLLTAISDWRARRVTESRSLPGLS